jgi:hypothetical protein
MASGLPVIVTGYGACMDYCDESNAYLVPASVERIGDRSGSGPSCLGHWWAVPSKPDLVRLMRHVRENPGEAAQKAAAGRARILEGYSWETVAKKVRERLEVLATRTPVRAQAAAQPPPPAAQPPPPAAQPSPPAAQPSAPGRSGTGGHVAADAPDGARLAAVAG